MKAMRLLAIDFGTSNTVAALSVDDQAPRTVTFDASPLLPSAVFVAPDGTVVTGREAQRQARLDPTRYEANPKRRIDDGEVLLGDRVVSVVDLIAAVLRTVGTEVRRQLGGAAPDQIRLTHPAQWGATRQNTLVTSARSAGLGTHLVLLPEPVAAAAQFTQLPGRTLPPGGSVAIYDLGGGTFDIAVVGRAREHSGSGAEFHVLAEGGLADLGGLDFDQAVLDHVGRTTSVVDPARWQQILRPVDPAGRRSARALADDVRAAKETLSRYPQTDIPLPDPFTDAHLTRPEFEALIRPDLLRSIDVLSATLHTAGVAPDRLSGIFLVGGSSRIPLAATLIQEQVGVTPVALDQPETAVALGALLVPIGRDGNRTAAIADRMPGRQPALAPQPAPSFAGFVPNVPVSGAHPISAGSPPPAAPSRRTPWLIAAAVAVIALLTVLIVVLTRGGNTPTATTGTDRSTTTGPATTAGSTTDAPTTAGSVSTGLGPNGLLSTAEAEFMGPAFDQLANCADNTAGFNEAVSGQYQATKVVRCDVQRTDPDTDPFGSRTLVYLVTTEDAAAAEAFLDQMVADRSTADSDMAKYDKDETFAGSDVSGRVVTAYEIPTLSRVPGSSKGGSAIAWRYDDQPYVGLIATLGFESSDDLMNYWAENYKPR
jgi:hypothetical protein